MQYLRRRGDQREAGTLDGFVVHEDALGVVVAVVAGGQVAQVEGHVMRCLALGGCRQHLGVLGQLQHQGLGLRAFQGRQIHIPERSDIAAAGFLPGPQHRLDARMRVLHVIDRVVVVLRHGQIDIECVLRIGLAREQEEAHRVLAGPLDQVAQCHVAAGALADLHLFPALDHAHHGVQHVVGVALRNAHVGRLQAGAHAGDGAVVVRALDVHHLREAALPFGDVVGHIGHEVRVRAVLLAHHAVLVVPVVGGLEPQRAVLLVGVALLDQAVHGGLDAARGVEARLQVVLVEMQVERPQILVLLIAQVGDGELADVVVILDVAVRGECAVFGLDGLLRQEVVRDILDVLAVVERLGGRILRIGGPALVAGLEPLGAQLRALGQRFDLHAGIVVVILAVHAPALGAEEVADRIAQGRLAAVAHVQRPRGIGGDELDQHALAVVLLVAEPVAGGQHLAHDLLLGGGFEADVQEAGAGDLDGIGPACEGRRGLQRGLELFAQRARVELERLGQLHGGGAGEIAVRGHLGGFEGGAPGRAGREFFQLAGERREQFLFGGEHPRILRAGRHPAGPGRR